MKALIFAILLFPLTALADQLSSIQIDFPAFTCGAAPVTQVIDIPITVELKGTRSAIETDGDVTVRYRFVDDTGNVLLANVAAVNGVGVDTLFYEGDHFTLPAGSTVEAQADCDGGSATAVLFRLVAFFSVP